MVVNENDIIKTCQGIEYIVSRIENGIYELIPIQDEYIEEQRRIYDSYLKNNKNSTMLFIEFLRVSIDDLAWFKERKIKVIA